MTTDRRDGSYAETLKFKSKNVNTSSSPWCWLIYRAVIVAGPSVRNRYRTSRNRPRRTCQPASSLPPSTKAVLKENRATEHSINRNCKINKEQHQQEAQKRRRRFWYGAVFVWWLEWNKILYVGMEAINYCRYCTVRNGWLLVLRWVNSRSTIISSSTLTQHLRYSYCGIVSARTL
jgi:hypothetical protein